jgi:hypothetical protein
MAIASIVGATVLVMFAGLIVSGTPVGAFDRVDESSGSAAANWLNAGDRVSLWEASLGRLVEHPLFGPGRAIDASGVLSPHNAILSIAELSGVMGIFMGVLWLSSAIPPILRSRCFGAPIAVCAIVAGLSMDVLVNPLIWALFSLACSPAAAAICLREEHPP